MRGTLCHIAISFPYDFHAFVPYFLSDVLFLCFVCCSIPFDSLSPHFLYFLKFFFFLVILTDKINTLKLKNNVV